MSGLSAVILEEVGLGKGKHRVPEALHDIEGVDVKVGFVEGHSEEVPSAHACACVGAGGARQGNGAPGAPQGDWWRR